MTNACCYSGSARRRTLQRRSRETESAYLLCSPERLQHEDKPPAYLPKHEFQLQPSKLLSQQRRFLPSVASSASPSTNLQLRCGKRDTSVI